MVWDLARGMRVDPERLSVLAEARADDIPALCRVASEMRDSGKGRTVTFSPKVFIPLTRMCRDFCGYCTFRQSPDEADRLYMSPDEVLAVARAGERLGCTEALFTLGRAAGAAVPRSESMVVAERVWFDPGVSGPLLQAGAGRDDAAAAPEPGDDEPA